MKKYGWEWKTEEGLKSWREILFLIISTGGTEYGSKKFVNLADQLIKQENCFPDSLAILATLGAIYSSAALLAAKDISLSNDLLTKAQKAVDMASKYIIDDNIQDPESDDDTINKNNLVHYYKNICQIGFAKYLQTDCKEFKYLQDIKPYRSKVLSIDPDDHLMGVISKAFEMKKNRDTRTASSGSDSSSSRESNSSLSYSSSELNFPTKLFFIGIILIVIVVSIRSFISEESNKMQSNSKRDQIQSKEQNRRKTTLEATTEKTLLSNGEYEIKVGDTVKLKNGKFERGSVGNDNYIDVTFKDFSLGNIDNEGAEDAAVILSANYGGSGSFYQLFILINRGGQFQQKGVPIELGDRVIINSMVINNGVITIDMMTNGPNDAMCCPTKKEIIKCQLSGDNFVRLN